MGTSVRDQIAGHLAAAEGMAALTGELAAVASLLCRAFAARGVVYTLGNGGSAADAQHLAGELIGHYELERRPLPAIALTTDPTVMTCIANDYAYERVFARQVAALVRPGDVVAAFTTTGRSPNVVAALAAARAAGATTVLFAGADGGPAASYADHALLVPSTRAPRIQEMHTLAIHVISELVDAWACEQATEGAAGQAAGERDDAH
jgi:D-sedoheptulose 7-phosphate isomerase